MYMSLLHVGEGHIHPVVNSKSKQDVRDLKSKRLCRLVCLCLLMAYLIQFFF